MLNILFWICAGLSLAGIVAARVWAGRRYGKAVPFRIKAAQVALLLLLAVPLLYLNREMQMEKWEAETFYGKVVSDDGSKSLRGRRYVIENPQFRMEFTDSLGVMKGVSPGTWVEKIPGVREVRNLGAKP